MKVMNLHALTAMINLAAGVAEMALLWPGGWLRGEDNILELMATEGLPQELESMKKTNSRESLNALPITSFVSTNAAGTVSIRFGAACTTRTLQIPSIEPMVQHRKAYREFSPLVPQFAGE
jgi:hypothetical protein